MQPSLDPSRLMADQPSPTRPETGTTPEPVKASAENACLKSARPDLGGRIVPLVARQVGRNGRGGMMLQLCLAALVSNALGFALPLFTMAVYDRVIPHGAFETLWAFTIGLAIVFLIDLVLRMTRVRLTEAVGLGANHEIQDALFHRLTQAELSDAPKSSGPLTAAFQSVEALCLTMPMLTVGLLIDIPFVIATLLYIGYVGGPIVLAPIAAIVLIVLLGVTAHLASRGATATAAALSSQRLAMVEETAGSLEAVKAASAGVVFQGIWRRLVDAASYHGHRSRMAGAYAQQGTAILAQASTVGCLVIGVSLITAGEITVGTLVAVTILVGRTIQPVTAVVAGLMRCAAVAESAASAERLAQIPAEGAGDETARAVRLTGAIDFERVSFTYPDTASPVLHDLSLSIRAGERVAVIGKIGCGKSSAARLIPRLYTADEGAIRLDGRDIRQFDPDILRREIAYMAQDVDLFDDTVYENICLGLDPVDPDRMAAAVHASGVHDFIARKPEGYSLRVGSRGRRLSGGERQAVALARTLMRDAPMLVLDEPTAAMDSQLERSVIERLKPMVDGKTLILATHRAPTLALVERVIWLEDGRIIADGPPGEVVAKVSARQMRAEADGAAAEAAPPPLANDTAAATAPSREEPRHGA